MVVNDGKATRSYTYDGGTERRGLPTSVTDSNVGLFTGTYDADGNLTSQAWPNGVQVGVTTNEVGVPSGLTYTQPGCGQADCTLYTETVKASVHGQWLDRVSSLSNQKFGYDAAGRLTTVADTVSGQCATRAYTFDAATNRSGQTNYAADSSGACQTATPASSRTWSFDTAERVNTAGYTYDALGRTLTMPGEDTAVYDGGQTTMAYFANDMARSITQGARITTYNLDVVTSRFRSWTDNASGSGVTKTNHYSGDGDSPSWTDEGSSTYTRQIAGLGGITAVHAASIGETYVVANLHGDFIGGMAETGYGFVYTSEYTEAGMPRNQADAGSRRYGYLGSAQRAADSPGGLSLMGARLYAPGSGRFLSADSVYGGSCSSYEYSCGDAVNFSDPSGLAVDRGEGGGSLLFCKKIGSGRRSSIFPEYIHVWVDVKCTIPNWAVKLILNGGIGFGAFVAGAGAIVASAVCFVVCITGVGIFAAAALGVVAAAQGVVIGAVFSTIKDVYADRCKPNGFWFKHRVNAKYYGWVIFYTNKLQKGCVTRA